MPGLPDFLRGPTNFILRQMRSAENGLGFDGGGTGHLVAPAWSLVGTSGEGTSEALWLSPGYHHTHGLSPLDDSLMFGFHYRNAMFNDRVKFDVHPFYAQSWRSLDGYWGIEAAFGMTTDEGRPWGTFAVR